MSRGPVKIERYNTSWKIQYEQYKNHILTFLDELVIQIEHVGSTSVEGLGAKPIIDIAITTNDIENPNLIYKMQELGYEYVDKYEMEMPFRKYFVLKIDDIHKVHVHIVPVAHEFFKRHIAFRDYLQKHRDIRDEYHFLKTRLASKFRLDRQSYQNGKSEFIDRITRLALEDE